MDEDLRMLVMKKSAGTPSDSARSTPLIQKVGPDFSKLSRDLNRVVLKIQHQSESSDCPMHSESDSSRRGSRGTGEVEYRRGSRGHEVAQRSSSAEIKYG